MSTKHTVKYKLPVKHRYPVALYQKLAIHVARAKLSQRPQRREYQFNFRKW
ncbi:uncharacterized protein SETTUDRAFT_27351 [Exserohilum turcica Et28A]|uniref:Uncharacterized protein n=1 Tax=Exserohilum turcicum (strain 28A) TaxID=671987 RepID=R0KH13_EXST2|nr:uncharacterized protein SETTUDRAFT_27351 [Exserohilum turcica Et28A]EOA88549.1 hypothetical protein SETTUDRAFT_27351 [Exserohilum turcica Et28A]